MQPNAMEINMTTPKDIEVRRRATIMDRTTLLDKGIRISDPKKFMWIQSKIMISMLRVGKLEKHQ